MIKYEFKLKKNNKLNVYLSISLFVNVFVVVVVFMYNPCEAGLL